MSGSRGSPASYLAVALLAVIIGYLVGREHVRREVASACVGTAADPPAPVSPRMMEMPGSPSPDPMTLPPEPTPREPSPLSVMLNHKGYRGMDLDAGHTAQITLNLAFHNQTGKGLRAFDGAVLFSDLLDNEILRLRVEINQRIAQGGLLEWKGAMEYNEFMEEHQRLRSEDSSNIRVRFIARKVLFSDGTSKVYE
ncbi:MAG: hypothetical protein HYU66_13225 [Armatimonadetes bacterium]|nr:hypothetical protein [Armatimonadota bacterium]